MRRIHFSDEHSPLSKATDVRPSLSAFLRNHNGAAAAEFALTVMLLVTFLFGIITFGWMFFLDNNMETAAREGARRMAVAEAPYAGSDVTCADGQVQTPGTAW